MNRRDICKRRFSTYRRAASSLPDPGRSACDRGCGSVEEVDEAVLGAGEGSEGGRNPPDELYAILRVK